MYPRKVYRRVVKQYRGERARFLAGNRRAMQEEKVEKVVVEGGTIRTNGEKEKR